MTTLNTPTPKPDINGMQDSLRGRLSSLGMRIRFQIIFDALVRALAVVLGLLTVSLVLDFWLELSGAVRGIYWLVTLGTGAALLIQYGVRPLRNKLGPIELAQALDVAQGHTGIKQIAPRVATVLQLPDMVGDSEAVSSLMINDAVGRSYRSLEQTPFNAALSGTHLLQCALLLTASLIVPTAVGGAMHFAGENVLWTWAQRWVFFSDIDYPRNTSIEVTGLEDGTLVIPAGEKFSLRTLITNKDGKKLSEVRMVLRPKDGKAQTEALTRFAENDYRLEMEPLTVPATATISAGDQSLRFEIKPAARPRLTGLKLTATHPTEPDKPRLIDFDGTEGEVALLAYNQVELVFAANVSIAEARPLYDTDLTGIDQAQMPEIVRVSDNTFKMSWKHMGDMRMRLELVSTGAGLVSEPIAITVAEKSDRKPSVRLRSSGVSQRITPNAMIPLAYEARDDYGLNAVGIEIVRTRIGSDASEAKLDPVPIPYDNTDPQREVRDKMDLEIDQFGVRPTDVIRLTGFASDNQYSEDPDNPQQTGLSTTLTFRIVTHKELFREIIARQQQSRSAFRQAIEDSKDVQSALVAAKTGEDAKAQSGRFRNIQRSVWKVGRELERSAEEMRLNRLGGSKEDGNQAYESMKATILKPLEKLHDQTMANQRAALEASANADPVRLAQLASDQQGVVDEMNALLKRMDRWDELLDAINQLGEVIDQQEQLRKKLEELRNEQTDDIFD